MTVAPGSQAAIDQGCTCPVMDNHYGAGMYTDKHGNVIFVLNSDCPIHGYNPVV